MAAPPGTKNRMSVFTGWTIPLRGMLGRPPIAFDHTYVTSDKGSSWGCWGRAAGGVAICSDTGDHDIAECLAEKNGLAGIIYGVTGVCHQIANRILHPAKQIEVSQARGYNVSCNAYGIYGIPPWHQLTICYLPSLSSGNNQPSQPRLNFSSGRSDSNTLSLMISESGNEAMANAETDDRVNFLRSLIRVHLKTEDAIQKEHDCLKNHLYFWHVQSQLISMLQDNTIDRLTYFKEFNQHSRDMMQEDKRILGDKYFYLIFGEAGDHSDQLIDPEIFFSDAQSGSRNN